MLKNIGGTWSNPRKVAVVLAQVGQEVPQRLSRRKFGQLVEFLTASGIEIAMADHSPVSLETTPGIEAKVRLRKRADAPDLIRIPGFEVLDQFKGGMADCFRVRDGAGVERFLKRTPKDGKDADALRRELAIYDKLDRAGAEHVIRVIDWMETDSHLNLVLELADGGSLMEACENLDDSEGEGLPLDRIHEAAHDIASGLVELHEIGVVHRDLKPHNVLKCGTSWKLADFGISKNTGRLITAGRTFMSMGSPGFTPPEQWRGSFANAKCDVYALGKVITYMAIRQTDVDSLLPSHPHLHDLVRDLTHHDPEHRPTAAEAGERIADLIPLMGSAEP